MIRNDLSEITKRMFGKTFDGDVNAQAAAIDRALLGSKDTYRIRGTFGIAPGAYGPRFNWQQTTGMIERAVCARYNIVSNSVTVNAHAAAKYYFYNPLLGELRHLTPGQRYKVATMYWADGRGECVVDTTHFAYVETIENGELETSITISDWSGSLVIPDYEGAGFLVDPDSYDSQQGEESIWLLIAVDAGNNSDSRTDYSTKAETVTRDLLPISLLEWHESTLWGDIVFTHGTDNAIRFTKFSVFTVFREGAPDWFIHFKQKAVEYGPDLIVTTHIDE